jgi:hypothetical protein
MKRKSSKDLIEDSKPAESYKPSSFKPVIPKDYKARKKMSRDEILKEKS